jgi:hypothetical protein
MVAYQPFVLTIRIVLETSVGRKITVLGNGNVQIHGGRRCVGSPGMHARSVPERPLSPTTVPSSWLYLCLFGSSSILYERKEDVG